MWHGAPWQLVSAAILALVIGAWPLWWILRRMGRRLTSRPQKPVGMLRYLVALLGGALVMCVGALLLTLAFALQTWHAFTKKTHVAEVQCIELAPQKLRVYFVPIERDGARGATEIYDVDGDQWMIAGDVLRFRPQLTLLGLSTMYSITRVDGHWNKADDANQHQHTAHDRAGGQSAGWIALYRDGERGPLAWALAGAHGQSVSQLPDRRTIYDVFMTPNGFVVDKRAM